MQEYMQRTGIPFQSYWYGCMLRSDITTGRWWWQIGNSVTDMVGLSLKWSPGRILLVEEKKKMKKFGKKEEFGEKKKSLSISSFSCHWFVCPTWNCCHERHWRFVSCNCEAKCGTICWQGVAAADNKWISQKSGMGPARQRGPLQVLNRLIIINSTSKYSVPETIMDDQVLNNNGSESHFIFSSKNITWHIGTQLTKTRLVIWQAEWNLILITFSSVNNYFVFSRETWFFLTANSRWKELLCPWHSSIFAPPMYADRHLLLLWLGKLSLRWVEAWWV